MPTKQEKGIFLDFPPGWATSKYDGDTKVDNAGFYRAKIARQVQHVRGVDVVSLTALPNNRLLLIEVKDYRVSTQPADREKGKLRQTVVQKALNTLSGLYAAARVGDAELRPVTERLFKADLVIEVVLLLEQPLAPPAPLTTAAKLRRQNAQSALNDLSLDLSGILHNLGLAFHLRSSGTMQARDGWAVRLA